MTGFTDLSRVEPKAKGEAASPVASPVAIADLTSDEIWHYVRRGRQIRSAHLAVWGHQMFETWKSLFRRPGSQLPATGRRAPV